MEKELTCIVCPMGCNVTIKRSETEKDGYMVTGNRCKRGAVYAIKEVTNPTRVLTSTVKVVDEQSKRLPVRTDGDIPKKRLFECMKEINQVEIKPPIHLGDIIISNILDTGVNVVASKSIE